MASITTQINIVDRMSSPLAHITSAVDNVISSLMDVDSAIDRGFDTSAIYDARQAIDLEVFCNFLILSVKTCLILLKIASSSCLDFSELVKISSSKVLSSSVIYLSAPVKVCFLI